jgi:predicted ATP-grasp superfamily ATP-dependent carboligase
MTGGASRAAPSAVVVCGGGLGAYDIVRTLGLAGIGSVVFACHAEDAALRSRYARRAPLLPEFREWNFPQILERLASYGSAQGERPVLLHAGDSETLFLSRHRLALQRWYRFALPSPVIAARVTSKARFVELARRAGLPLPPTRVFADAAELDAAIDSLELPCIVKPASNQDWFWETPALRARYGDYKDALRRFERPAELREFCAGLPRRSAGFVVQAYIEGSDRQLASFHAYLDEQSHCLGYFLTRAIRTRPPGTGDITLCETFHDEALARASRECLARIGFRGIVKIDYKWDAASRSYRMLEIEPHYQTAHLLGAYAGVNLARIAYRHLRGEAAEAPSRYADGVRLLDLREDLKAYWRGYRKTKEWTAWRYLASLPGRNHFRLFDARDPGPFLHACLGYLRRQLLRVIHISRRIPLWRAR